MIAFILSLVITAIVGLKDGQSAPEGASASKGVEIGQQVNVTVPTMTPTPTTVSSTSQRFIMDNFDTDSNNTRESRESKNFATPDPEDMEFTDNYAINITGLNKNERDRMRSLFLNILMTRNGSDYNEPAQRVESDFATDTKFGEDDLKVAVPAISIKLLNESNLDDQPSIPGKADHTPDGQLLVDFLINFDTADQKEALSRLLYKSLAALREREDVDADNVIVPSKYRRSADLPPPPTLRPNIPMESSCRSALIGVSSALAVLILGLIVAIVCFCKMK